MGLMSEPGLRSRLRQPRSSAESAANRGVERAGPTPRGYFKKYDDSSFV